ncbi:hypothetical protein CsSME_00046552 [Camellia sinensis var. sinensis]
MVQRSRMLKCLILYTNMVPTTKTGRRKKTTTNPIASPSGTSAHVIVTPQTLSDETQPPNDTQTFVEETQAHGVGKTIELKTSLKLGRIFILINKLERSLIRRRISCIRIGGVCLDDWKHMIDVAWKDASHLKRSKAGKTNWSLLPYNHTSGSRSFPIAMSLMVS